MFTLTREAILSICWTLRGRIRALPILRWEVAAPWKGSLATDTAGKIQAADTIMMYQEQGPHLASLMADLSRRVARREPESS